MKVKIELFANLRKFMPNADEIELGANCTVHELLEKVGINSSDVAVTLVNGKQVKLQQPLHDGERVSIFPPIAGG